MNTLQSIRTMKNYNRWEYLGLLLAFLYIGRGSALCYLFGSLQVLFQYGGNVLLVISVFLGMLAPGQKRFSIFGIFFILVTFPFSVTSGFFSQSLFKWAGWVLLFGLVGPVIKNVQFQNIRLSAWRAVKFFSILIGTVSYFWYLLNLPSFWRGTFTGITTSSMILGPIAGMSVLFCLHDAIRKGSRVYLVLAVLSIFSCLLAGSRTAIVSLLVGLVVFGALSFRRLNANKAYLLIGLFFLFCSLGGVAILNDMRVNFDLKYFETLQNKGLQNTRKVLWSARWREFSNNPLFGVGIGQGFGGEDAGVVIDAAGNINVEPGSSYLALLSMTGVVGTACFAYLIIRTFFQIWRQKSRLNLMEMLIIGVFLSFHMVSEGWIYAVGSPFCFLFWLWLGHSTDQLESQQLTGDLKA